MVKRTRTLVSAVKSFRHTTLVAEKYAAWGAADPWCLWSFVLLHVVVWEIRKDTLRGSKWIAVLYGIPWNRLHIQRDGHQITPKLNDASPFHCVTPKGRKALSILRNAKHKMRNIFWVQHYLCVKAQGIAKRMHICGPVYREIMLCLLWVRNRPGRAECSVVVISEQNEQIWFCDITE